MSVNIILQGTTPEALADLISTSVKSQLEDFTKQFEAPEPDRLLTREQTAELLQINLSTLWHWERKGKVQSYGIANRRYYKYNEVIASLQPLNKIGL
jgi:hypothetical protein